MGLPGSPFTPSPCSTLWLPNMCSSAWGVGGSPRAPGSQADSGFHGNVAGWLLPGGDRGQQSLPGGIGREQVGGWPVVESGNLNPSAPQAEILRCRKSWAKGQDGALDDAHMCVWESKCACVYVCTCLFDCAHVSVLLCTCMFVCLPLCLCK